ncbi:MAG: hypothetical protein HC855_16455 [Rhizobiales bacterium]|nr:hypothetical protein [Hyphomicrobiales bacterium]
MLARHHFGAIGAGHFAKLFAHIRGQRFLSRQRAGLAVALDQLFVAQFLGRAAVGQNALHRSGDSGLGRLFWLLLLRLFGFLLRLGVRLFHWLLLLRLALALHNFLPRRVAQGLKLPAGIGIERLDLRQIASLTEPGDQLFITERCRIAVVLQKCLNFLRHFGLRHYPRFPRAFRQRLRRSGK